MPRLFISVLAAFLLIAGPAAATVEQDSADRAARDTLRAPDLRIATIGYRLASANRDWCVEQAWLTGFVLHDLSQYDAGARPEAIRLFGMAAGPAVLVVVPGGPAAQAGLRTEDVLLALDGRPLVRGAPGRAGSFAEMERILAAIDAAFAGGRASLTVRRGGTQQALAIQAVRGCATRFQLTPGGGMNAQADGVYVQVTTALADYAADDAELAAVLAHEFAHNVLGHRVRLRQAGVQRGVFENFGRNAREIRATEIEADRLSVWLMARAGYDPRGAVRFWSRFGRRGFNFLGSPTHPNWRLRVQSMEAEIAKLEAGRAPDFVTLPRARLPGETS